MVSVSAKRGIAVLLLNILAMLMLASGASAQALSSYTFSASTGSGSDMSGASSIFGSGIDDAVSGTYSIGFTFVFNNTSYTTFGASSNGYMGLGATPSSYLSGSFSSTNLGTPIIAPLWRDLHTGNDGYVQYKTSGSVGSRVLTVEWKVRDYPGSGQPTNSRFQVRLYEGSNRFDIWYGPVTTSGGTVGAQISTSNYASITPSSNSVSYSASNGSAVPPSNSDRVFSFDLCTIAITGNTAQGGTALMNSGDSVLTSKSVMRGSSGAFTPFTIIPSGCQPSAAMTYTLSGTNASEYSINPPSVNITPGSVSVPSITFSPQGTGPRRATLTVTGSGFSRIFYLAGRGTSRIQYVSNVAQGGSTAMNSGDTLLQNLSIKRGTSVSRSPFTLTSISGNSAAPAASVTYQIRGFSGGQYSINPPSAALAAGQTSTPSITFTPTGVGLILDTLVVTADNEVRVFPLQGFSEVPGIEIIVDGQRLDSTSELFRNTTNCVGQDYAVYQMRVTNIGADTLRIFGFDAFATDTAYRQGVPTYPLLRDASGTPIDQSDYIITDQPPVLPVSANTLQWPIELTKLQSRTLYLSFSAQRRNKRNARIFLRTNAQNVATGNAQGVRTDGLIRFDVFGSGVGSRLANASQPVLLPATALGASSTATYTLHNMGECTLRVALDNMEFTSGDVNDFKIDTMPGRNVDPATGELLIAPGDSDQMTVRFTPHQPGSHRASLRLRTNDSAQNSDATAEHGVHYVDFYGSGQLELMMSSADFGQVPIDAQAADQSDRTVTLVNTSTVPVQIDSVMLEGVDAADFAPANWPALPVRLAPNGRLDLHILFAPKSPGTIGVRNASVRGVLATGESLIGMLQGEAATRTVAVTPLQLNFAATGGKVVRQTVTITNTGTMPLKLDQPAQPGGAFSIVPLARLELAPGQAEFLEVVYAPASGASTADASISLGSNATNGAQVIALHGTASRTSLGDDHSLGSNEPAIGVSDPLPGVEASNLALAGVTGTARTSTLTVLQSTPNPAHDRVEIRYTLPTSGTATLALYDALGNLVQVLDEGAHPAGENLVHADLSDLPAGVYHYRLTFGSGVLDRTLTLMR